MQDEEDAKVEAITKAFKQAHKYAQALANDAGIRLGNIIELSVTNAHVMRKELNSFQLAEGIGTPISPGNVEVSAYVSLSFAIEPNR